MVDNEEEGSVKFGQHAVVIPLIRSEKYKIDIVGVILGVREVENEKNQICFQGERYF